MQEPARILSTQQRSSLESVFTTLKALSSFLQSIESQLLQPDEKLQAINLLDLADLSQRKLVEAFPELLLWAVDQLPDSTDGGAR